MCRPRFCGGNPGSSGSAATCSRPRTPSLRDTSGLCHMTWRRCARRHIPDLSAVMFVFSNLVWTKFPFQVNKRCEDSFVWIPSGPMAPAMLKVGHHRRRAFEDLLHANRGWLPYGWQWLCTYANCALCRTLARGLFEPHSVAEPLTMVRVE